MTRERLLGDLTSIGVGPGMTLVVHSSLRAIGWVGGGAATVVAGLIDAIGTEGTLAMPAATPQLAGSASRFDRGTTPTSMGAIPETFRTWPGTVRSDHPLESVCARGPAAEGITSDHPLEFSEGPGTPFGKIHELDGKVLLLGVGFNRCTALHFAETVSSRRRLTTVRIGNLDVSNVADDDDTHFPVIGERFMRAGEVRAGRIGQADSLLFSMRELVAFAKPHFERILGGGSPHGPGRSGPN